MTTEKGSITPRAAAILQAAATIYAGYGFPAQTPELQEVAVKDAFELLDRVEAHQGDDGDE